MRLKSVSLSYGPTWGCGYTAGTAKHQYTATSYSDNLGTITNPITRIKKDLKEIPEEEVFPDQRKFYSRPAEFIKNIFIDGSARWFGKIITKLAVIQTGQIQHYVLYGFLFMILVLLLTLLKLI